MKKIHRFLVKENPGEVETTIVDTDLIHLVSRVLKLHIGEQCILFADGGKDYLSTIVSMSKQEIVLRTESIKEKVFIPRTGTACVSIIKGEQFETVVQKLTELGIQNIVPLISNRTVKQSLRLDRLQKISDEALEQSGGSSRVHISEPLPLKDALELHKGTTQCYFDIEGSPYVPSKEDTVTFYIGPEGGWSDADKVLFKEYTVPSYLLGGTILRAETAAIVATYTLLWQ